ncbi:hypothetical protein AWU67_01990 [Microterricola viridarii]|uniref:Membrane protein involved in the export of O-antigen and teichoic acid n=1 Tax=Microterricola viridarii TaxID=412690 RepID=A0A0Y0N5S6_9MICO|nr:hypothetical protein AWU67_01990 [Microterricola viridarii]
MNGDLRARLLGRLDLRRSEGIGLAHRGALSLVGVMLQGGVRFLYSVLIGRFLTPALLAATNSAISLALFVSLLWPTATATAATKFVSRAHGAGDAPLALAVAKHLGRVSMVAAGVLGVGAGAFSWLFQDRQDLGAAILVTLLVLAWSGYTYVRGLHFAVQQVARATLWDGISAIVALALLVVVIVAGADALLLAPLTAGYALYAICGWPRGEKSGSLPAALRSEINHFTFWTVIGTLASTGLLQLSMLVAHGTSSPEDAALYAVALTLATPLSMLARSFSLVLFPSMARATGRADHASVRAQTDLSTRGLVAAMGLLFGALAIVGKLVIVIAFGARYADAFVPLVILLAACFLVTVNIGVVNALSAGTQSGVRLPALFSVVGMVIGLCTMALTVPGGGITAVAAGYLAGAVIIGLAPIIWVWVREGMRWGWTFLRALFGVGCAAALIVLDELWGVPAWATVGTAAVFAIIWLGLMWPEVRMIGSMRRLRI